MAQLAVALPYLKAAGTVLSVVSTIQGARGQADAIKAAGRQRQLALEHRAEQMRVSAGQQRAVSQREAIEARKKGRLAQSRALALGAAGGSAEDVAGTLGELGAYSEYNALTSLYEGEERAIQLEHGGELAELEGRNEMRAAKFEAGTAKRAGYTKAATTVYDAYGGELYNKYAPKGEYVDWDDGSGRTYL